MDWKFEENVSLEQLSHDCLWIILRNRKSPLLLQSSLLEEIDWKMGGALTRYIETHYGVKETTFIPPLKRLQNKLVALDFERTFDPVQFERNIEGLKAKRVCVVLEDGVEKGEIQNQIQKLKLGTLEEKNLFICPPKDS